MSKLLRKGSFTKEQEHQATFMIDIAKIFCEWTIYPSKSCCKTNFLNGTAKDFFPFIINIPYLTILAMKTWGAEEQKPY